MLKELFVSEVRVKILSVMLPNPSEQFHVRALVRAVGTEINAVRRELDRLTSIGLLKRRPSGNRVYYTVDTSSIFYFELLSLIAKEQGIGKDIISSKKELGYVSFAVLSKSFSMNIKSGPLDIDLFMVGNINTSVLQSIIRNHEDKIGREINYSVMNDEEFMFRKRRNDQFVNKIMSSSRTMLIGNDTEFSAIN